MRKGLKQFKKYNKIDLFYINKNKLYYYTIHNYV